MGGKGDTEKEWAVASTGLAGLGLPGGAKHSRRWWQQEVRLPSPQPVGGCPKLERVSK